jgi:hypothetical protein
MVPTGAIASSYSIWIPINTAVWANCLCSNNLQHQLTVLLTSYDWPVIVMIRLHDTGQLRYISYVECSRYWYVTTDWTVRDSNTSRRNGDFFCLQRPGKLSGPTSFLLIVHWGLFTLGLSGVRVRTSLKLFPKLRMSGVIRPRPFWDFIAYIITIFPFHKIFAEFQNHLSMPISFKFTISKRV